MTFFYKKVFPTLWFGGLSIFLIYSIISPGEIDNNTPFPDYIFPLIMMIFGYFLFKYLVFDLADEVYDEGMNLLFKKGKKEARIKLTDIKNISYSESSQPPRVTVSSRTETPLGSDIKFIPVTNIIPFGGNKKINELIDRVDRARQL